MICWDAIPYFHGLVLDFGSEFKQFPHWISVDAGSHRDSRAIDVKCDPENLVFTTGSVDAIYASYLPNNIREWLRVIKPGGHLMLTVEAQVPGDWDLLEDAENWHVYQIGGKGQRYSHKTKPEKTCAVVRYGAQGDMIQASSILPWLKEQGYHVTVYCQEGLGYEVIKHDPHVDRFIIQGKDEVPNHLLLDFWTHTEKKYDKFINLSESVEGTLLASPGRAAYYWPNEARAVHMDRNYVEWTHELAGVPPPYKPKFYSTVEEKAWAKDKARSYGKRNILWSLAGSSGHKVWPHLDAIIARVMLLLPGTDVVLVGDEACQILEHGWDDERRVHRQSGKWSIRESMAFAEVADLVIGTETGLLNAAGHMDTPKIITLSHSSPEMLTKHWVNTIALQQPKGVGCPKSPCRQLHGSEGNSPWMDCPQHEETGTALCQFSIGPEQMWDAIVSTFNQRMAA